MATRKRTSAASSASPEAPALQEEGIVSPELANSLQSVGEPALQASLQDQLSELQQQVAGLQGELVRQRRLNQQALADVDRLEVELQAAQADQAKLQELAAELAQAKDAARNLAEQNYKLSEQLAGQGQLAAQSQRADQRQRADQGQRTGQSRTAAQPQPAAQGGLSPERRDPYRLRPAQSTQSAGLVPARHYVRPAAGDRPLVSLPSTEPDVGWFD
jgi:septal ring factor EnvC (AmiA/AmiB activator)